MTMLRVLGLSILIGCAAAMLVWFGSGLIANLRAVRTPEAEAQEPEEAAGEAGDAGGAQSA